MLNGLRDLFLAALKCETEEEAKRLIREWNEEIKRLQELYDHCYDRMRFEEAET